MTKTETLPPTQNPLFGRWGTHPEHGRVLCIGKVLLNGDVRVALPVPGTVLWLPVNSLKFDPLTPETIEQLEKAVKQ